MGQELECRLRLGRRSLVGKAYLETDHILFRGEERVKIPLKVVKGAKAEGGVLRLEYEGGPAVFELGAAAARWEKKILHPPTRADKLGIKPGQTVRVIGGFEKDFLKEIAALKQVSGAVKADQIFLLAPERSSLDLLPKLTSLLQPAGGIWVVYPKGLAQIREIEVLQAGRAAGLKDTKVMSFSQTHTGLRFVIPVQARK